jgi:pSer/pThr/pTyr-binding forkhead associated (FHA) protein
MQQIPSPAEFPLPYGLLVLGLALALIVLFLLLRKRPQPSQVAAPMQAIVPHDATLVFSPQRSGGSRPAGGYAVSVPDDGTYLVPLLDDAGTPGTPIPIRAKSLYIGRDESRAQIVLADPSVSRLHARLMEESEGVFMLHDEGSASGTFVNDERVDLKPRQLASGDVIEFGRQVVVFVSGD